MPQDGFNWVVLIGGYSGDGSKDHKLFRLAIDDDRVPFFNSHAAAEEYVLMHKFGEAAIIAEVTVSAAPAIELNYLKTGRRIVATKV